jgi:DHA1 family inner membrane transport protein
MTSTGRQIGLRGRLVVLTLTRFVGNLTVRFPFAFLPTIARGLGVSLTSMGVAFAIADLAGLSSAYVGHRVDRGHNRLGMVAGMTALSVGALLAGVSNGIVLFTAAITCVGLGKATYDTAMNTWIGHSVPFYRRGRITGITEYSWALSFFIGVPILGLLIDATSWRGPFILMAVLSLVMAGVVYLTFPADSPTEGSEIPKVDWDRQMVAVMAALAGIAFGQQMILLTYAAWLEDSFDLAVQGLGFVALVIGIGEIGGTTATVLFTDRLGKRRAIMVGVVIMIPGALLLPATVGSLPLALLVLALIFLGFEFALISWLPLLSEIRPEARGTVTGYGLAVYTFARAAGALAGPFILTEFGINEVTILAAASMVVALAVLYFLIDEPETGTQARVTAP